jgi:hypothetical protein
MRKRHAGARELSVEDRHRLKVALDTLKMPDAMAGVMGGGPGGRGMSKAEARAIVARLTGKAPAQEVSAGAYMGAMFSGRLPQSEGKRVFSPLARERGFASAVRSKATDAGNRSMRRAGRTVWDVEDYNAAVAEYNRLMDESGQ